MNDQYLYVERSALPDYFEKVVQARALLESGKVREVSEAVKEVGISRSTYYKYRDCVYEPSNSSFGRKAVLSMLLADEPGVLSAMLNRLSDLGANILTITQSLPVHRKASVTLSLDVSNLQEPSSGMFAKLETCPGVEQVRLIALE